MSGTTGIEEQLFEQGRIASDVLMVMANIAAVPVEEAWRPAEELVTAAVYFIGPWEGAMLLECELPLAFEFTSRLMSLPPPLAVDADVSDSLGELVNMIAGNFKALMPAETDLSTPSVVQGSDYALKMRRGTPLSHLVLGTDFGRFRLTLVGVRG